MRLTTDRLQLLTAVSTVAHFTSDTGTITANGTVSVTGTENGSGARHTVANSEAELPGETTVPLPLLQQWLANSSADRVRVISTPTAVIVHGTDHERIAFAGEHPLPSPPIDIPPTAATLTMPAAEFRRAVSQVAFAVAKCLPKDARWSTNAVKVGFGTDGLTLAATDEIQLAVTTTGEPTASAEVLVSPQTVRRWSQVRSGERVTLSLWSGYAAFQCGMLTSWSPTIAGSFPSLIPIDRPHAVSLPNAELLRAIQMALAGADPEPEDETDPKIRFVSLRLKDNNLTIRGETASEGRHSLAEVPLPDHRGHGFDVTLDGIRLAQYLKVIPDAEQVEVKWTDDRNAFEFAAVDQSLFAQSGRSWYLITPRLPRG